MEMSRLELDYVFVAKTDVYPRAICIGKACELWDWRVLVYTQQGMELIVVSSVIFSYGKILGQSLFQRQTLTITHYLHR